MSRGTSNFEVITLGGGCFWCTEAVFSHVPSVLTVEPGYAGGATRNPTYAQVSRGDTGHAEVVQVTFDRSITSLVEILEVFFSTHDPTTLNRQGADIGTQYRSVIFYHTAEQFAIINDVLEELSTANLWDNHIVTQVEPFTAFYKAEEYHVNYYSRHRKQPYCQLVIVPKLDKLRKIFRDKLKA